MRVRGDEIVVGDSLSIKVYGSKGEALVPVDSIEVEVGARGQRRIRVKCIGFPPFSFAPHSKHTVRRAR